MQPLSGNQRPDLATALMNMSLVLRLPRKKHLCRSSSNVPRLPSFLEMPQNLHVLRTFDKVHNPLRLPRKTTLQRPRVARTYGVLRILTWKCASRHNGVHFFDISTTKSGLRGSAPVALAPNHWKNTVFRDFPTFSSTWIFFRLRLSLCDLLSSSSLLWLFHLCFSSVHIVRSLTSKLPSILYIHIPVVPHKAVAEVSKIGNL